MMTADQIRSSFLAFFKKKNHSIVASDLLVPQNDPTLLFTGAGMNQFKDYFLGIKTDLKRAATSQKCLRTGDLDEVGRTPFHHSFFEMLGNFSFGDYFKEEAIAWAWEYLTQDLKLPKERLRVTVHEKDVEAYKIWRDKIRIRENWIYKCGDKSNFWPSNAPKDGPNGPCGPCSEIYYDRDPGSKDEKIESPRFAEIWNLVFTQYDRGEDGGLAPLKNKNIDTGMGLERLACILQGKKSNFEIDIFEPINQEIRRLLKLESQKKAGPEELTHLYSIADHARAVIFSMTDGVIPSNEGRGYVIRKLIRRALYHARDLTHHELNRPFLYELIPAVSAVMGKTYPELEETALSILSTLKGEEERFLATLETGLEILQTKLRSLKNTRRLPGDMVFELYDTYGFPDELTRKIAGEEGFEIDQAGFDFLMNEQRKRAKGASPISANIFSTSEFEKKLTVLPATKFLGFESLESHAHVLLLDLKGKEGALVLDQTPFYGESGGQVGDRGTMSAKSFKAKVLDTQKKDQHIVHKIEIETGGVQVGDEVCLEVDRGRRERAMRNHTATHLLHAALREILGKQTRQLGSLVAPEKLRFDFSYPQALTSEQIRKIEDRVNQEVLNDAAVAKEEKSTAEAKKEGAIAFFGEKYGSKVRVITVPGFSKELCGGTHCDRTGQIGAFVIISDSSIASGTRRIEAFTGEGALNYLRTLRSQMAGLALSLKTTPEDVGARLAKLQEAYKKLEKERKQGVTSKVDPQAILKEAKPAGALRFLAHLEKGMAIEELRNLSDRLRQSSTQTVYLLGSHENDKTHLIMGVSHDLVKSSLDVRDLWKGVSAALGASGGGRKDLVQGGAQNLDQVTREWQGLIQSSIERLKKEKIS